MKLIKSLILPAILVGLGGLTAVSAQVATGGVYTLKQGVIASGGGSSSGTSSGGTTYQATGTAGQAAAGTNSYGGTYALQGGFWNAQALGPTAAQVSISGKVITSDSKGLTNARVMITDAKGTTWSVMTTAFGNFRFDGLSAGETVIVTISSKRYTFAPQVVALTDSVSGLVFTAQ